MKQLMLEPTATAQWQSLVSEAETACHRHLGVELQSYLVFLLMRFVDRPELAGAVLATEYLRSAGSRGQAHVAQLRDVGDQCLLYSGLFPCRAERKLVRVSYFVGLGRSAYDEVAGSLARHGADMYAHLSEAFITLMEVLQTMRTLGGQPLGLLHGVELWNDTGSVLALRELEAVSNGFPVREEFSTHGPKESHRRSH